MSFQGAKPPPGTLPLDPAGGLPSLIPPVPLPPNPRYANGVLQADLVIVYLFLCIAALFE